MSEKFADDVIEELIDRLGKGEGLATICRDPRMPSRRTVFRWMRGDDELAHRVMDAREIGFHDRAERAVEEVRNATDPIKARVVFDAERWYLGKISQAFAEKPVVGLAVNVDAGDSFAAIAGALEGLASAREGGRTATFRVDAEGTARPAHAAGELADLAGAGGERLGEDPDGG